MDHPISSSTYKLNGLFGPHRPTNGPVLLSYWLELNESLPEHDGEVGGRHLVEGGALSHRVEVFHQEGERGEVLRGKEQQAEQHVLLSLS